jgi:hypothetical protein
MLILEFNDIAMERSFARRTAFSSTSSDILHLVRPCDGTKFAEIP